METSETPESRENHQVVLRLVTGLFRGPYLPFGLISFLALAIITNYAYILMREPVIYWLDYSREAVFPLGGFNHGPFVSFGISVIYIIVLTVILRLLNCKIAIILWSGILTLHLSTFMLYPPSCRMETAKVLPGWLCNMSGDVLTFIIGSIVGVVLLRNFYTFEPTANELEQKRPRFSKLGLSRLSIILSTLWLLILGVGIGIAARIPTTGWLPLSTDHAPSPRYEAMVAYDTLQQKAILFGGMVEGSSNNWTMVNETWAWDGNDWTQLQPEQFPPARARGAMAYDPKRKVTLLFGGWNNLGKSLNDTWIWDGNTWEEAENCDGCYPPPSRGCHNMFYDAVREQVILYGGCNEFQTFYHDAWGWNGDQWENIDIGDSPVASGAPIVYDPNSQSAVGFLAWQPSGTWIWDKDGWSKPAFPTEPPLRGNSMMANDPQSGNNLMFGGTKTEGNVMSFYGDTWFLNGRTWNEIKSSLTPPGRWGHVIFFDTKLQKFILFGGHDGKTALNDLWEIKISTSPEN